MSQYKHKLGMTPKMNSHITLGFKKINIILKRFKYPQLYYIGV